MSVVTLPQAKAHLNITVDTSDPEISDFLNRAEAALAKRIGPLAPVAKTERVRGMTGVLRLSFTPILSLTSVTSIEGNTIDVSQLTTPPGGRVEFKQYGIFASRWYDVVYQAGRNAPLDEDIKLNVLELVRRLWSTQRGPTVRPGSGASPAPASDGLLSAWVDQLSAPYRPILGA